MSPVQWILLIVAIAIVVGIYLYSRRDRRAMRRYNNDGKQTPLLPPTDQQLDIFAGGEFDEFGVGKARPAGTRPGTVRAQPDVQLGVRLDPSPASEPPARATSTTRTAGLRQPSRNRRTEPTLDAPQPDAPAAQSQAQDDEEVQAAAPDRSRQKIISLLFARRDGAAIEGARLHAALRQEQLEYGEHRIYHRLHDGRRSFSVASLVKPGYLDPDEADAFSTPGLMLFMMLPGPREPQAAVRDMLTTAGRLADALEAQVYDASRAPLDTHGKRELRREVESWVLENGGD